MYLACKIDEFNVSIDEFCSNLKCGTSQTNAEIILSYELDILYHLNYQLTVHTPHRPFEGFFIDIKVFKNYFFNQRSLKIGNSIFRLVFPNCQIN